MSDRWFEGTGPGHLLVRDAIEGVVAVFERHGAVLHALADAATVDTDVELAYGALVQGFIDATARHIEAEMDAGNILQLDARETAKALIWMEERYLISSLGRTQTTAPETVVDTLAAIWTRTLYGAPALASPPAS